MVPDIFRYVEFWCIGREVFNIQSRMANNELLNLFTIISGRAIAQ